MLLLVVADYENSPVKRLLQIDEETGGVTQFHLDTTDADQLHDLYNKLDNLSYANFTIHKVPSSQDKNIYEFLYSCKNEACSKPQTEFDGRAFYDEVSFTGFLRRLIKESSLILLPFDNVPEQDIPQWMVANANTIQFTDSFGIKVSSLIPGSEEGYWKWHSTDILRYDWQENINDFSKLTFLTHEDFDTAEYESYLTEHGNRTVVQANGDIITYRSFTVSKELRPYPWKQPNLVIPSVLAHLKYVADAYKLALYTLTEGLFEDKKIEYGESNYSYAAGDTGRHLKMHSKPAIRKATANALAEFYIKKMNRQTTTEEEMQFRCEYPHFPIYESILSSKLNIFYDPSIPKQRKFRTYQTLKNTETYFNLLLAECKHHVMYDNNAFLFSFWAEHRMFQSDIPNYKVQISGGGGKWQPTYY